MPTCVTCGSHVLASRPCPSCGRSAAWVNGSAVALLLGLVACAGQTTSDKSQSGDTGTSTAQPGYGVSTPTTDDCRGAPTSDSDTGSTETGSTTGC